jgi:hypothetical protein
LIIRPIVRVAPGPTVTVRLLVLEPAALAAVRVTVKVPAAAYVWVGFWSALVPPSPKFQDHVVGDPVDASENCTETFAEGDAGENVKEAVGLDDEEDDDEAESPQAETRNVPRMVTDAVSQAR